MLHQSLIFYAEKERLNLAKLQSKGGKEILWSNKLFKMWKKEFHRKFQEKYQKSFREVIPNANQRAQIYESIFRIENTHIIGEYGSKDEITEATKNDINAVLSLMGNEWSREN